MTIFLQLRGSFLPFLFWVYLALALPASAQQTYLNHKQSFDTAWSLLADQIGDSDLLWLRLEPDSVSAIASTGQGGEEFNLWSVRRIRDGEDFVDKVFGPLDVADGPRFITRPERFTQAEMRIADLWSILQNAPNNLPTETPGEVTAAVASLGPVLGQTDWVVKWNISVKSGREFG